MKKYVRQNFQSEQKNKVAQDNSKYSVSLQGYFMQSSIQCTSESGTENEREL